MVNQNLQTTPKTFLRTISIIHLVLNLGLILFAAVTFFINSGRNVFNYNTNDPFVMVAPLLAIAGIAGGIFLFKKQVAIAQSKDTLKGKLALYQGALIQKYALVEGPAMFAIVAYDLSGNLLFLIIAGLLLLYFISIRPTKDRLVTDLDLSYEDKITFDSEDTQI